MRRPFGMVLLFAAACVLAVASAQGSCSGTPNPYCEDMGCHMCGGGCQSAPCGSSLPPALITVASIPVHGVATKILQVSGLRLETTKGGKTTTARRTLYVFTIDGVCPESTYSGAYWPYAIAPPRGFKLGPDVFANISVSSTNQIQVNGHLAYTYALDGTGTAAGSGQGDIWFPFASDGSVVRSHAALTLATPLPACISCRGKSDCSCDDSAHPEVVTCDQCGNGGGRYMAELGAACPSGWGMAGGTCIDPNDPGTSCPEGSVKAGGSCVSALPDAGIGQVLMAEPSKKRGVQHNMHCQGHNVCRQQQVCPSLAARPQSGISQCHTARVCSWVNTC